MITGPPPKFHGTRDILLPKRGHPDRQACRSPSDALGKVEVQAAETQRGPSAGMVERSPATVTKPVRALGAAVHDLTTERHEPDKPRGLRPDLWGTAGEIPAVYPALSAVAACDVPTWAGGRSRRRRPSGAARRACGFHRCILAQ